MRIVCPICKTVLEDAPDDHPVRPFCTQRCKNVDLYHWLSDEYRIPSSFDSGEVSDDEVKLS